MARQVLTARDLEAVHADLLAAAEKIEKAAGLCKNQKEFPGILAHASTALQRVQFVFDWSATVLLTAEIQTRDFAARRTTKAELDQRRFMRAQKKERDGRKPR